MNSNRQIIALIPARSGSKRYRNKNITKFCGQPLTKITLDFALKCAFFDRIVLSTDIPEIIQMKPEGVELCERPGQLAGDNATLLEVIQYTSSKLKLGSEDVVVLLPVTGPLRLQDDITAGIELFEKFDCRKTVVSVSKNPYPATMLWKKQDDFSLTPLFPEEYSKTLQKQKHESAYMFNDIFVMDSVENYKRPGRNLFGETPVFIENPPERSMPIDYEWQFKLAEVLYSDLQQQ